MSIFVLLIATYGNVLMYDLLIYRSGRSRKIHCAVRVGLFGWPPRNTLPPWRSVERREMASHGTIITSSDTLLGFLPKELRQLLIDEYIPSAHLLVESYLPDMAPFIDQAKISRSQEAICEYAASCGSLSLLVWTQEKGTIFFFCTLKI